MKYIISSFSYDYMKSDSQRTARVCCCPSRGAGVSSGARRLQV
jgi:hypothetical protein